MPRRSLEQVQAEELAHDAVQSRLKAIRNSWYFANIYQFIYIFGDVLKIDSEIDIDVLEAECLKPEPSQILAGIGLSLLKWISSHRGLTLEIFEEYTRRQYLAKAPELNPFGDDEEPTKFHEFDLQTKLKILHQLSVWIFWNPDRMREKLPEKDYTEWRMDPFGWDAKGRAYYVLDDNRLYRKWYPSATPAPKKQKQKKAASGSRSSKRQRLANGASSDVEQDDADENSEANNEPSEGLGGARWECVAVSLEDYHKFLRSIEKSKNADEKEMYNDIKTYTIKDLETAAAAKKRQDEKRMRELEALEKMATAKRSSRLAGKVEQQKVDDERRAAEEQHRQDLNMAHREQEKQQQMELDRESRMQTREQRLKDREVKRILEEEKLAQLQHGESVESEGVRMSERSRKAQVAAKQRDLDAINQEIEEEKWRFDCSICGQQRDSTKDRWEEDMDAIACEKCGIWQHSACHGIKPEEASRDDYHFTCHGCTKPKNAIKLNVSSPAAPLLKRKKPTGDDTGPPKKKPGRPRKIPVDVSGSGAGTALANGGSSRPTSSSANGITNGLHQPHLQPPNQQPGYQNVQWQPPSLPQPAHYPSAQAVPTQPSFPPAMTSHLSSAQAPPPLPAGYVNPSFNSSSPGMPSQTPGARLPDPLAVVAPPALPPSQSPRSPGKTLQSSNLLHTPSGPEHMPKAIASPSFATPNHPNPITAPSSTASARFLPSPHAGSNAADSGKSPVKQAVTTPASSFGSGSSSFPQASLAPPSAQALQTPGKGGVAGLQPAPVLSPSVNTGPQNTGAPVKRATPEKPPAEKLSLKEPLPEKMSLDQQSSEEKLAVPPPAFGYPPAPPPPVAPSKGGPGS